MTTGLVVSATAARPSDPWLAALADRAQGKASAVPFAEPRSQKKAQTTPAA